MEGAFARRWVLGEELFDRRDKRAVFGLRNDTVNSYSLGLFFEHEGVIQGEEKNRRPRQCFADDACCGEAAHLGHGEIEQNKIGLAFLCAIDGFRAVLCFAADSPAWVGFDFAAQGSAKARVVIGDENVHWAPPSNLTRLA